MKTLIIHPYDPTTKFLCHIYKDIKSSTVVTHNISKIKLIVLINTHDNIIMLGHGSPFGLFNSNGGYIIDKSLAQVLKNKPNSIFIWCNADRFVTSYGLKGLYSGMFISEVTEAQFCGVLTSQDDVTESNNTFSKLLGNSDKTNLKEVYQNIKINYGVLAEANTVAKYNNERLFLRE